MVDLTSMLMAAVASIFRVVQNVIGKLLCCIDGLLERTIKHMLFLQSMTKHAENLKHSGESKIISKDGGLLLENNFDGGATWAFEVGSHSMVCPIIVEDLSTPRQILVEILCEEQGLFLEIADIIRGLGLTILKGVMEARNDKVWVRFTVEVLAYLSTHGCSAPTRIECLSEKILPVGTEISAVGRVHTSLDGNPQIEACQDLPFFLSKMTKAEILVDLSATMTARLCIAVVLRSVAVGVIAYASRREWRQWKEWRKQRRRVQQLRSEAAAQVHESVDDEGANGGNSDMPLCVICFMRRQTVMFTPCGHLICCSTCALSFQEDSAPKCPICREAISDCFKVYF